MNERAVPERYLEIAMLKVIGWTVACIGLLYGACVLYARNNDPEYVARAAHEPLMERDAEELLALATPEEVEALGLTEQNLQRFIDDYVFRGFSRVEFEGDYVDFAPESHSAGYSLSRKYRVDSTSTMTIYFSVNGQGSIKHLISSLFEGRAALGEDPR